MSVSVIHNCGIGEFTVTICDNGAPVFALISRHGDVYRATEYSFNLSSTKPLTHDDVPNAFKQVPTLEFDQTGAVRATMCYKGNTVFTRMMKLANNDHALIPILVEYIRQLEGRITQLETPSS